MNKFINYKFILVIENQNIFSYVSEKLIDSMASGSLPIYYGFEDIDKFFPDIFDNAVINGYRYNYDELFNLIKNMSYEEWSQRINNIQKIIDKYLHFFSEKTMIMYMLYKVFNIEEFKNNNNIIELDRINKIISNIKNISL